MLADGVLSAALSPAMDGGGGAPQWLARPGRGAVASLQTQFPDVDADVRTTSLAAAYCCVALHIRVWLLLTTPGMYLPRADYQLCL